MTPSAATVFTGQRGGQGDNSGAAAILDKTPDFFPIAQQILTAQRDEKKEIERQQRQADRDWSNIFKTFDLEGIALEDAEELGRDVMGLEDEAIALKGSGVDPLDYYGEAGKTIRQKQQNILNKKAASDANNKFVLDLREQVATNPKLDKAHAVKWLKGYDAIKNKGIQAKNDYIKNNNPYRSLVTVADVASQIAAPLYNEVVRMGGRPFQHTFIKDSDVESVINFEDQQVKDLFNQGLEDGKWKDESGFVKQVSNSLRKDIKEAYKPLALKKSEGKESADKLKYGFSKSSTGDPNLTTNIFSVKRVGTDGEFPEVQVRTKDGKLIDNFQPSMFEIKDGKIQAGGVIDDGKGLSTSKKEIWVDYDTNAANLESLLGESAYDIFKRKNSGATQAPSEVEYEEVIELDGKRYGVKAGEYYELD